MSVDTAPSIPTPEAVAREQLAHAPTWMQRLVSNSLAVLAWVGLPTTLLSTLSNLRWVVDASLWLHHHAGVLRPVLAAAGAGISAFVHAFRSITHPVWQALFGWLHLPLPDWAPDVLTLAAIVLLGFVRHRLRTFIGNQLSGSAMWQTCHLHGKPGHYEPLPIDFPYKDHYEYHGYMLPPRRLADTSRLWRKWRAWQLSLVNDADHEPRYLPEVARAQFGRYWFAVMDGRRDRLIYLLAALLVAAALCIDWAYRGGFARLN